MMETYPDELDFISLFCVDAKTTNNHLPYHYRETIYEFTIHELQYKVTLFPSVDEFSMKVKNVSIGATIFESSYKTVSKIEILKDTKHEAAFRLFLHEDSDRFCMIIDIAIKPYFSVMIKEDFT